MGKVAERFWSKVTPAEPDECWLWKGHLSSDGYGRFSVNVNRRYVQAHRWVYEHMVGPIPDGLVIDHLCRTPACVNPYHLEPVTIAENNRRGLRGPGKPQPKRDHCKRGHAYAVHGYTRSNGYRYCRECLYITRRARRARQREEAR